MGRPFFPHEADDPDLDWLVSNFLYDRPNFVPVDTGNLPLMLMPFTEQEADEADIQDWPEAELDVKAK
jgi:hypothetical protein